MSGNAKHVRFSSIALARPREPSTLSISSLSVAAPESILNFQTLDLNDTHNSTSTTARVPRAVSSSSSTSASTATVAPPRQRRHQYNLHHYLAAFEKPAIDYDLRDEPTTRALRRGRLLSRKSLSEPATHPPCSSMTVHCPFFLPSWGPLRISVEAPNNRASTMFLEVPSPDMSSSSSKGTYLTVQDVLTQLYAFLRRNVTAAEYAALTRADKDEAKAAYEARYRRFRAAGKPGEVESEREKKLGMKRIDFFQGHTKFIGFASSSDDSSSVWVLSTG